ncbi:MAG TPA: Rne/Rng family ribonuclease, partial [Dongiaceae bacterium]|nr:Rne/Rng family ribonuclease [Dongiaceae bacterium]
MLIDATHPEETRVAVVDGRRLEEFDVEVATKKLLKGNIYLAKITRVEPSLQAAFVEYGGNRHGFLAFSEIHPDYYRIPVEDREALLAEQAALAREQEAEPEDPDEEVPPPSTPSAAAVEGDQDPLPESAAKDAAEGSPVRTGSQTGEAPSAEAEAGEAIPLRAAGEAENRLASEPFEAPAPETATEGGDADQPQQPAEPVEGAPPAGSPGETGAAPLAEEAPLHRAMIEEAPAVAQPLEVVGGDESEEPVQRRPRPISRRYKIQDVIKRRQILLVQVTKEERGNKGAALTTYLSLAGRYCVLMPNTDRGGGVSRKITNAGDRKRLKSIIDDLEVPPGMAVIVRTAGSERSKPEVKRDFEYLLRLWDEIRELTLRSTAPALIYEEANLIKRAIRDLYTRDIEDIQVEGDEAYRAAKSFMRMLMPSHARRVQQYKDPTMPLFTRYQIESQLDAIHNPVVQLRSGGYIVINQTEALVAIDVNSGRATRERNIEETALKTNLEAADEIARQLRLRDLAGLIVIDFIDMDEARHNSQVERRLKEAMRNDRARIQLGRISPFGLLELSRQRLRPSLFEASTEVCRLCRGTGHVRSTESTALHVLRSIEEESSRQKSAAITVSVPTQVALFILNHKRRSLAELEARQGFRIYMDADESLVPPDFRIERMKALAPGEAPPAPVVQPSAPAEDEEEETGRETVAEAEEALEPSEERVAGHGGEGRNGRPGEEGGERRRGRRRRRRGRDRQGEAPRETQPAAGA